MKYRIDLVATLLPSPRTLRAVLANQVVQYGNRNPRTLRSNGAAVGVVSAMENPLPLTAVISVMRLNEPMRNHPQFTQAQGADTIQSSSIELLEVCF
ncbi:MAG: hypothetical protein WD045_08640 [Pirellulaceae bacterium]